VIATRLRGLPALRRRMLAAWGVALVLGAGAYALADHASHALPRPSPLEELSYYPSGEHIESATLGHGESAADLAWIRAVQYYGEHRRIDNRFDHLFHIFDILTTLAPHFEGAYIFGAFALAQEGRDFGQAEQLMLKGLDRNPRSGRLAFETGFLYYVKPNGRDLPHAAEYFELASRLPGAPGPAREFAAFAHQSTGSLAVAYHLWQGVRDATTNRYLREMAEKEMDRIRTALETGREEMVRIRLSTPRVHLVNPQ
jgi:hypothetical protein